MNKTILALSACALAAVLLSGSATPALAQISSLNLAIQQCAQQVRNTPGGPVNSYMWNSTFDAYYDGRLIQMFGTSEGQWYFQKCLRQKGAIPFRPDLP
jgi:hypothetical protein